VIIKFFELNKINLKKNKIFLFYGKNEGLKKESISKIIINKGIISNYDEKEILDNKEYFFENLFTSSLFDKEKIIIIKRATDKILKIIEQIIDKNLQETLVFINSESLEKRSKLRTFFEKDKNLICTAFYPDNTQTLSKFAYDYLKLEKTSLSQENINLIVNKCNGDREILRNELGKIVSYSKNGKKIDAISIFKLINLLENYSISELIDNCLAKNKKKIISILNENNFSEEDCIVIIRTLLLKSKKILKLSKEFEKNKNIDLTISTAKPPIFWKDKEITKQQIYEWAPKAIKNLIYEINHLEFLIKKKKSNPINLVTDFILKETT